MISLRRLQDGWRVIRRGMALGPEVHSASNRNEYQKQKNNNVSGE
jgi:hypothetical protein